MRFSPSTGGFYPEGVVYKQSPADLVTITNEEHRSLLDGQRLGKLIVTDEKGRPQAVDPAPEATFAVLAMRAERDRRLSACDWTQMTDAPLTKAQRSAWLAYRQALRDLPSNTTDPAAPTWPAPPNA